MCVHIRSTSQVPFKKTKKVVWLTDAVNICAASCLQRSSVACISVSHACREKKKSKLTRQQIYSMSFNFQQAGCFIDSNTSCCCVYWGCLLMHYVSGCHLRWVLCSSRHTYFSFLPSQEMWGEAENKRRLHGLSEAEDRELTGCCALDGSICLHYIFNF